MWGMRQKSVRNNCSSSRGSQGGWVGGTPGTDQLFPCGWWRTPLWSRGIRQGVFMLEPSNSVYDWPQLPLPMPSMAQREEGKEAGIKEWGWAWQRAAHHSEYKDSTNIRHFLQTDSTFTVIYLNLCKCSKTWVKVYCKSQELQVSRVSCS